MSHGLKAFVLAAGLGTRLRPVTDSIPKCLVQVGGRTMLDIWLDALAEAGVDEVVLNTHHFAQLVEARVVERKSAPFVTMSHEPQLLGSAGTLFANREFVADEEMFLVVNADNLTDFDLRRSSTAHRAGGAVATLSVFRAARPSECGVVEVDVDGRVVGFTEKPPQPGATSPTPACMPSAQKCWTRSSAARRGTSAIDLLRAWWAGPGRSLGDGYFRDIGTPDGAGERQGGVGPGIGMIITQTPLRVGLLGGGTDLPDYYREHGGRVLNAQSTSTSTSIVKQRFDNDIYVNYSKKEIVSRVEDLEHELVREAMHMTGVRGGLEITTLADIPSAGSGLGSSSAVTVGLLHALFAYKGRQVTAEELAERACTIEIERCRKPIGKQDQYAAAFGGICDLQFGPGDRVVVDQLD